MRPFLQSSLRPALRRVVIQRALRLFAVALICPGLFTFQAGAEELATATNATATNGAAALPDTVDLRSHFEEWGLARRNQGGRGTCSVFTMTGALEYAAASKRHHGERFSVEFLNWGANKVAGENQDGGFFSDLWSAYAKYGICLEKTLPYRDNFDPAMTPAEEILTEAKAQSSLGLRHHWIKEWNVKTGLTDAHFLEIKRTLKEGWPVCGGFRWPKQVQWTEDVLGMCPPEAVFDGHSVLIVGYREDARQPGGGVLIFRNTNNGGRDGFMPYAYARAYMNDAIWVDVKSNAKTRNSAISRSEDSKDNKKDIVVYDDLAWLVGKWLCTAKYPLDTNITEVSKAGDLKYLIIRLPYCSYDLSLELHEDPWRSIEGELLLSSGDLDPNYPMTIGTKTIAIGYPTPFALVFKYSHSFDESKGVEILELKYTDYRFVFEKVSSNPGDIKKKRTPGIVPDDLTLRRDLYNYNQEKFRLLNRLQ